MVFDKIVGNEKNKELLQKLIKSGSLSHSYLFLGTDGIGKSLFAKEFAKMILCMDKQKPCGTCKSCLEFSSENHPDFVLLNPDGNSIKIEQIRVLQEKLLEKPIVSNYKVYIINDADTMTKEAANCLLKTLEEPPEFVIIILIGSNENLFLPTIRSRCTKIVFQPIEENRLKEYLEKQGYEEIATSLLKMFAGSIKKALDLKDKKEIYGQVDHFVTNIENKDLITLLKEAEVFYQNKEEVFSLLEYSNILFFDKIKQQDDHQTNCIQCIETIEETKKRLHANSNFDMCIDYLCFSIWEEFHS